MKSRYEDILRKEKKTEVIELLASGKYPPVTTTIIWTFLFGRLSMDLIRLATYTDEDTHQVRVLRGSNPDIKLIFLQRGLMIHIIYDLVEYFDMFSKIQEKTEKEIIDELVMAE